MKAILTIAIIIGLGSAFGFTNSIHSSHTPTNQQSGLKESVLNILQNKCNVCHKTDNPFMVFSSKNMDRRAEKIYKQVFVKQRMPKGDSVKLTEPEYAVLKKWLKSKNLY